MKPVSEIVVPQAVRRNEARAFTLLELLVASAVLLLVGVLMLGIFSSTVGVSSHLSNSMRLRQDASVALHLMATDLASALRGVSRSFEGLRWSPGVYERAAEGDRQPQLLINPAEVPESLQHAGSIFWYSGAGNGSGESELVGYVVRYIQTPAGPRPRLARLRLSFGRMQEVLLALKTPGSGVFLPDFNAPRTPGTWVTEELVDEQASATVGEGFQGWLADNVLALYARPLDPFLNPILSYPREIWGEHGMLRGGMGPGGHSGLPTAGRFDSRVGYQFRPPGAAANALPFNVYGPALPTAVEVVIVAAAPDGIRKLETVPASVRPATFADADFWPAIDNFVTGLPEQIRQGAKVYSTVVHLPGSTR